MEEIQIQYIFFIPRKKIQQVPQQEEQKNLNKMEKSGIEKLPNPMSNFLSHLNELDKTNLMNTTSNLKNGEQKEERPNKVSQTQRQSSDFVKFDEDDSELQRCRRELEEIQRQQREKLLNSSLSEKLFQTKQTNITSLLDDSLGNNYDQRLYKQEKKLQQEDKKLYKEFNFQKSEQQEFIENSQRKSNEKVSIEDIKWKNNKFQQRQEIIFEYEPEQDPIIITKIEEDKSVISDRKMIVVSENQMEPSEQGKQFNKNQNINHVEPKDEVEQYCAMMEIQCEAPQVKNDKNLQNHKDFMNSTERIDEEKNNKKPSNSNQLVEFKPQNVRESDKSSLNTPKQSVLSKQSVKRPKIVEQLREQQVHKITQNLEGIFEIFKRKLPLQDEIEIIRALYLMYIGPENTETHKPKMTKPKDSADNMNKIETKSITNFDISSKSQPTATQKKSIIEQLESENRDFEGVSNQVHLEPRSSVVQLPIPKRSGFIAAKNPNTLHKRAYNKRGGDGLGNPRYMDEQKVAMLFIKKGYGLHVARSNLGPNIQNNQYTNLVTTIIREAWRKIQDYVARIRRIKSMNTNEFKVIKTSLVNCVKWMDATDLETFYGFMKFAYQMDNRQPYQQEAIRLYNSCIRRYEELRGQYQTQMKVRMDKKIVQKLNPGQMPPAKKSYPNITKQVSRNQPKVMRNAPSDRQLEDLTSLIKSQLRQNGNTPRSSIPNRQIQINHPNMRSQLQQGMNFAKISQTSMDGQRK